ncbi:hypothetical protein PCH70_39490 [Pseudomonas cichorii JBC1]|nr:hypothetical protein PCH70_39490 [Pseudomonas cichorii JBC1]
MAVLVIVMVMIVVAIRAMDMGLLVHRGYSVIESARIISQMRVQQYL